jgi:glycosyltransferase involved in cell wall biosynthesis
VKLAYFSPLPPAPTGIADYSADVLALLAARHDVVAVHDQETVDEERLPCPALRAERFTAGSFDAAVYQLGNGPGHDFIYAWLARAPGLLVLHDLVLHHARARMFLASPEALAYAAAPHDAARRAAARPALEAYEAELEYSYPGRGARLAEAHLGTVGDLLPYAYPLFRIPVEASRAVGVHNQCMAEAVATEVPDARVARIAMPVQPVPVPAGDVVALRARLGLAPDELVVACFGLLTREKRIETVARAVARACTAVPRLRLLLVGPVADRSALDDMLDRTGVRTRTTVTGRVPLAELAAHMEVADIVAHLRYPTARETSAALLRVLAQGRPAIVSDLENLDEVPEGAAVKVDVADEEGEVTRAILRLAASAELRARVGAGARRFARTAHAPQRCLESYEAALDRTLRAPLPGPRPWPGHFTDGAGQE